MDISPLSESVDFDLFGLGVDDQPDAPQLIEQNDYEITVPEIDIVFPDKLMELLSKVDPLQDGGNHGVNLCLMCVQAILTSMGET